MDPQGVLFQSGERVQCLPGLPRASQEERHPSLLHIVSLVKANGDREVKVRGGRQGRREQRLGASPRRDATRLQSRSRCAGLFGVLASIDKQWQASPSSRSAGCMTWRLARRPLLGRGSRTYVRYVSRLHHPVPFLASMCRRAQALSYERYAMFELTFCRHPSSRSLAPKRVRCSAPAKLLK